MMMISKQKKYVKKENKHEIVLLEFLNVMMSKFCEFSMTVSLLIFLNNETQDSNTFVLFRCRWDDARSLYFISVKNKKDTNRIEHLNQD